MIFRTRNPYGNALHDPFSEEIVRKSQIFQIVARIFQQLVLEDYTIFHPIATDALAININSKCQINQSQAREPNGGNNLPIRTVL